MALDHVQSRRKLFASGSRDIGNRGGNKQIGDRFGNVSDTLQACAFPAHCTNGERFLVKTGGFRPPTGSCLEVVYEPGRIVVRQHIGHPTDYPIWDEV